MQPDSVSLSNDRCLDRIAVVRNIPMITIWLSYLGEGGFFDSILLLVNDGFFITMASGASQSRPPCRVK